MDIFTGIFGIFIGIVGIIFGVKFLKLYFKVKGWDRVEAKVVSKEIALHQKYSTTRTPYKLSATYKYVFNGSEFIGTKIYLANSQQVNVVMSGNKLTGKPFYVAKAEDANKTIELRKN